MDPNKRNTSTPNAMCEAMNGFFNLSNGLDPYDHQTNHESR